MGEKSLQSLMVTLLALAEPQLKIRKHVTVEAVWIKFDEIQLVVKFQQFQKKPKCSAMAQFSQVMDTGIEPITVADEGIDIPAESRHGFEDQNRYLLLGQPQGSAEAAGTATYHDSVIIRQLTLLAVKESGFPNVWISYTDSHSVFELSTILKFIDAFDPGIRNEV